MRRLLFFLVLVSLSTVPLRSSADTVEISGGGHLTGSVDRNKDFVIVTVDDRVQVAIEDARVRRVVRTDQLQRYRELASQVGQDAERHYQLAIWCVTGDNVPGDAQRYKRYHMERAIAIDPDHVHARAALGYKKHEGKWVLSSKLMQDRGMVMRGGHWEPAEAAALEEVRDATNVDSKLWIREVNRLVGVVLRNSSKSQEALQALQAIRDPVAAQAIAQQLDKSRKSGKQSRALRMLWVKLLGNFRNSVSVRALVQAGIEDQDETIREAALDQLVDYGASSARATYLNLLKPPTDNKTINRAARALTWFPDPELALTYVDSLVTKHTKEGASGPGMQVGFGDTGGGLSMGGKKKVQIDHLRNPSVLSLIKSIEPNVDHGYDEQAWQRHFASQRSAFSGDLRRDP